MRSAYSGVSGVGTANDGANGKSTLPASGSEYFAGRAGRPGSEAGRAALQCTTGRAALLRITPLT